MTAVTRSWQGAPTSSRCRRNDGSTSSVASERSGVRSVDILLDGESVEFAQQECEQGSCSLSRSWDFNTAEHPGGEHVVEVVAEDHLGHQQKQSFSFEGGPCCIGSSTVWGNALARGPCLPTGWSDKGPRAPAIP